MMAATGAKGIAIGVVDKGQVVQILKLRSRNAAGDPLELDSIMYGASLTKTAFAYYVLQLR